MWTNKRRKGHHKNGQNIIADELGNDNTTGDSSNNSGLPKWGRSIIMTAFFLLASIAYSLLAGDWMLTHTAAVASSKKTAMEVETTTSSTTASSTANTSKNTTQAWVLGEKTSASVTTELLVHPKDSIYGDRDEWDGAPIVLEDYKLVFFTIPKVACTTLKQLFRRMMHASDWQSQDPHRMLPHNPKTNGLQYLYDYNLLEANELMTSSDYTRAVFVRDPKLRFLSAFLDKGLENWNGFIEDKCCPQTRDCAIQATTSQGFFQLIQNCSNAHWDPQAHRMESKYWKYINFVGHFEQLDQDGPQLLKKIGAWEEFGSTGWGTFGNSSLFQTAAKDQNHVTNAQNKIWQWLTPALERKLESYYAADYNHPLFGFSISNLTN